MLMLSQHLLAFLRRKDIEHKNLVIALSGGVDSVALLLAAVEAKKQAPMLSVSAIHVNHGLSDNAQLWQEHCRLLCQRHQIEFVVKQVSIIKDSSQSVEHLARTARYKTMASSTAENSIVLTAHHLTDQAETFLLRLMRRSGLTGLGAMREVSNFPDPLGRDKNIRLARPFLTLTKVQLTDYVEAYNTTWVEDESNLSLSFDRNFLRQKILPSLAQRWPDYAEAISRTASLLQADSDLLNEYVKADLVAIQSKGFANYPVLIIEKLAAFSDSKLRALLRLFCFEQTQSYPSQKVIGEIRDSLISAKADQQPAVQSGEFWFRRHRGALYITKADVDLTSSQVLTGEANQSLVLSNNAIFNVMKVTADHSFSFEVCYGKGKDKLKMANDAGSKNVKQAFKDMGCPPWWRNHVPLIYRDSELIAIGDRYIHSNWQGKITVSLA